MSAARRSSPIFSQRLRRLPSGKPPRPSVVSSLSCSPIWSLQEACNAELKAVPSQGDLHAVIEKQAALDAAADAALAIYLDAIDATLLHREKEYEGAVRAARRHGVSHDHQPKFAVRRSQGNPGCRELGDRAARRGMATMY